MPYLFTFNTEIVRADFNLWWNKKNHKRNDMGKFKAD
jgi:hypothetical protein